MSEKIDYVTLQTFWQEPDVYDGTTFDKHRPRWMTTYPKHGKEEDGEVLKLEIDARSMPPGSRVTIEVPVCPKCGEPADFQEPRGMRRKWPNCRCGFSWSKWVEENFS